MGGNSRARDSRLGAICGILLGILLVATFAVSTNFPAGPSQADATLAGFSSFRTSFLAADIFLGLAAVFAVAYFAELRNTFDGDDRLLVGTATLLAIVGIVVTAVVFIGEAIALDVLSGVYATGGISKTAAVVVAQGIIGFGTVEVFGFLLLGAGFAVYGFLTIRGKPFPRWLGYVGMVEAIFFLGGSLPVSGAYFALIVGVVLLLVWLFASSAYLWKSSSTGTV